MKKNKYENIKMIDLEDKVDDIVEIYINRLYNTDKTVGIIVNKEIAEYILDELVKIDDTSIKEVDLVDYMNIDEYLVSVDDDGVITVVPIEDFCVLDKTDIFYIDMDGDIEQDIIDYCVNENKEVILFGQEDEYDVNDDCLFYKDADVCLINDDNKVHGFMASKSNGDSYVSYSYYSDNDLTEKDIYKILKSFNF